MSAARPLPKAPATIVVRLSNWVGDVVMNTPFLMRLREVHPRARIIALGRRSVTSLLANHPATSEVWTIDDRETTGLLEAARRLRSLRADLGYALPNSFKAALLLALGGVRHRVGYARDARRVLLTQPVPLRPDDLAVHETRYYLRLLDVHHPREGDAPSPHLALAPAEVQAMEQWLAQHGIRASQFLIGVNPAAFYGTAKRWDATRYAEAARILAEEHDAAVVVTGLPAERDVADVVVNAGGARFHNAAGQMSLRELMAFLARANLFLTNDSGAMHIAAALGTPLVAVFGSTDWVTTAPLSPRARIVRVETECAPCLLRHCPIDHRCMARVTVSMVVEASRELLRAVATP